MFNDDQDRHNSSDHNSEDIYSVPVRAGKRTYFFDVKGTKGNKDYFLTITESKRRMEQDGRFSYDKHKIFLYKEDFQKFEEGLSQAIDYMKKNLLKDLPESPEAKSPESGEKKESDADFTDVNFEEL